MRMRWVVWAAALAACSEGPAAGGADAGPAGPTLGAVERVGSYLPAHPSAVLPGVNQPFVLVGHVATHYDRGDLVGLGHLDNGKGVLSTGLQELDTATGRVRLVEGVPTTRHGDWFAEWGEGAVSIYDLTWVVPDTMFAAAGLALVVVGERAEGNWVFRSAALRAPGADKDAQVIHVAYAGGELFAGSDQGVAVLDPATLAVRRWLDLGSPRPWVHALRAGTLSTPSVAAVWGAPEAEPTKVGWAPAGAAAATEVALQAGDKPLGLEGFEGHFLVGVQQADGRGAVRALAATNSGVQLRTAIDAGTLEFAAPVDRPWLPGRFALDAQRSLLLVGGRISSRDPGESGGLVAFEVTGQGLYGTQGREVLDRRRPEAPMLPWEVEILVVDSQGRYYVGGQQLCSAHKRRQTGLFRIERQDTEVRLSRPVVSGVRAIAVDEQGTTWLGLRDETPGEACNGINVQANTCRLKSDGSCEIFGFRVSDPTQPYDPRVGAAAVAFGRRGEQQLAIASVRGVVWVRKGSVARMINTTLDPGLSQRGTAAAWGASGELWVSSLSEWDEMGNDPDDPNPIDWAKVNDRGPHGVGWLKLDGEGAVVDRRRWSRNKSEAKDYDTPGMPSNSAWDVLPLPGEQRALVALGIERWGIVYDHQTPDIATSNARGGLVEVQGTTITPFAPPAGVVFGDVVEIEAGTDGSLWALDADAGVLEADLATHTTTLFAPPAWNPPERALSLAVDGKGHVAVGTDAGLYVYNAQGAATRAFGNRAHGFVWTLRFMADGALYAGTDQGLVRVAVGDAALPAVLGPSIYQHVDAWALPEGCGGFTRCACAMDTQCVLGHDCVCSAPSACTCRPRVDTCAFNPGVPGCDCGEDKDCNAGLTCDCSTRPCLCKDPAEACKRNCSCATEGGCPDGFMCQDGMRGPQCVERPDDACRLDCSCPGLTGCPVGETCETGLDGSSRCQPEAPADPCLADCSCGGPGLCLVGYSCLEALDGSRICEPDAPAEDACLADCSCLSMSGCPDGYTCQGGRTGQTCVPN